ncbi:outer membrane beta-barrel protein [Segetibacter koreensis]|uniref:outer membrane beta-barrel protein n=1 Tax=Segetibacter koreensis TaxID=398037 RepID=UPI00037D5968|nr:outer membrane beta-barrel protein [Segetibacter koreensis]
MQRLATLVITCILFSLVTFAQHTTISGSIEDTINKQTLPRTGISLLRDKDSVLVNFERSDSKGNFSLRNVNEGKYIILFSYPSYADYIDTISVKANENKLLGRIMLTLKSKILQDVLVKSKVAAIRIKGDTTEYTADSFKVREGASVEEMLRKLPGLQVDKDGKITAQGEEVKKVLVDGEEFFGNDPTMATKNLPADAINKVQVFDKKSDQAVFSGIDDGKKTKTINLTMKDDKKKGYFGKLELAGGLNDKWNNTLMLNSFRAKRKFSVYGIMSSTGKTGLDWGEQEKFGEGIDLQTSDDGGLYLNSGGNDEFSQSNFSGQGIPKSWSTGLNYSNKFNNDKQIVNGNYRYNKLLTQGGANTYSQFILPDTVFYQRDNNTFNSSRQRNSVNGTYEVQLDSFTSIKIKANAYKGTESSISNYVAQSIDKAGSRVNSSSRSIATNGDNSSLNSNFVFRKRFRKIGRTLSLNFTQEYLQTNTNGFLNSINDFYGTNDQIINTSRIDQMKLYDLTTRSVSSRLVYTEPVVKNVFVELNYGLGVNNSDSKKLSYDNTGDGKYDALNDTFSNNYNYHIVTNSGGMGWRYNSKKVNVSLGSDIAQTNYRQKDIFKDTLSTYSYTNLFPKSTFTYKFNSNSNFNFSYNGNTQQPTIQQIQPVRDNSNTLNIFVGNPNLKQQFRQSFNLGYNSYKVLSQQNIYTYFNFNTIRNAISSNQYTATSGDSIGKTIYQYVNVNGNYNGYGGGGFSFKWTKPDIRISPGLGININRSNNIVNNLNNVTNNESYEMRLGLSKYKEKKFTVFLSANVAYNHSRSSIRQDVKTKYFTHTEEFYLNYTLPWKFEFNTNVNAEFRQKTSAFDRNNNVIVWNAYIGRKLFKNDKGLISLRGNDLLDQNKGFSRYIGSNVVTENSYTTLRRFFQINFTWNFSKTPGGVSPSN